MHSTSRVIAGGPITNDVYKCHTKSVAQAIADGDYGAWESTAEQQARLEEIHPEGVCDVAGAIIRAQGPGPDDGGGSDSGSGGGWRPGRDALARTGLGVVGLVVVGALLTGGGSALRQGARRTRRRR